LRIPSIRRIGLKIGDDWREPRRSSSRHTDHADRFTTHRLATVTAFLVAIGFGAIAFGKQFHLYSIATIAILVAFGALTFSYGPQIAANLLTPANHYETWYRKNRGRVLQSGRSPKQDGCSKRLTDKSFCSVDT